MIIIILINNALYVYLPDEDTANDRALSRYNQLKQQHPKKYACDMAAIKDISEAELTATRLGHQAQPLRPAMAELLHALAAVVETKCITRNEYALHEQPGTFSYIQIGDHTGIVLNPRALDLRVFVNQWASVFHMQEMTGQGERQSIQFFDRQGDAALKVYVTNNTDMGAWQQLRQLSLWGMGSGMRLGGAAV